MSWSVATRTLVTFLLTVLVSAPASARPEPAGGPESVQSWVMLGSFRGSTSSRLMQEVRDLLFELETQGDLYEDLGTLSLGVGADKSHEDIDVGADWDNSFRRRVEPRHEALGPGQMLTGEHISRYVDAQSVVSRGRVNLGLPERATGGRLEVGPVVEGGVSLTLLRQRRPLVFADRPLAEILGERDRDEFLKLDPAPPPLFERSLVHLSAEGVATLGNELARLGGRAPDTEKGAMFYQNTADSVTLLFDVGVPIPVQFFTEDDDRLGVGDRVRFLTFLGFSPLSARYRRGGLESRFQTFRRTSREVIVTKQAGNRARVEIRHLRTRGHELVPLKLRPEIRFLSIVKLGHTLFEKRWEDARGIASTAVFELDLANPEEVDGLQMLLAALAQPPLAAESFPAAGDLKPHVTETQRTESRSSSLRISLFSTFRLRDHKLIRDQVIESDAGMTEQALVTRARRLRRRLGRDLSWSRRFLVRADFEQASAGAAVIKRNRPKRLVVLNGLTDAYSQPDDVARVTRLLRSTFGSTPALEEILQEPATSATPAFFNVYMSFEPAHLDHFLEVGDAHLWRHLAQILLGPSHASAWVDETARRRFRKSSFRRAFLSRKEDLSGCTRRRGKPQAQAQLR
ncbi:MAG: hypothetical protein AAFY88_06785 [Acidobacteriota bacterium]